MSDFCEAADLWKVLEFEAKTSIESRQKLFNVYRTLGIPIPENWSVVEGYRKAVELNPEGELWQR